MGFVYVLTNPAMPGLVKIGCTDSDDVGTRISQLYSTGVPVPFEVAFAARVPDIQEVERALHRAFAPNRINPKREFFRLDPDQPIAILQYLHEDATTEVSKLTDAVTDEPSKEAAEQQKRRRPRFNFDEMAIPSGAILRSTHGEETVVVVDARRVRAGDEDLSLTAATRRVLANDYDVAPGPHWTYEGKLLSAIYEETYPDAS